MKELIQRWEDFRPTKVQAFWTGVVCVVATLIIGFGPFGWVTGGTARKMADEAAATKYQALAAAVCAEEFMRAADSRGRLAKLKALQWYERDDVVASGGWATMPGETEANTVVAELCATSLAEQAEAAAKAQPVSAVKR
jgi:hypothetical protein